MKNLISPPHVIPTHENEVDPDAGSSLCGREARHMTPENAGVFKLLSKQW